MILMLSISIGNENGRGFRDIEMEQRILKLTQNLGIGAQFGGKYFCHDVRVIRLPRHGASCPVGIGVSCSADRQVRQTFYSPYMPNTKIINVDYFVKRLKRDNHSDNNLQ